MVGLQRPSNSTVPFVQGNKPLALQWAAPAFSGRIKATSCAYAPVFLLWWMQRVLRKGQNTIMSLHRIWLVGMPAWHLDSQLACVVQMYTHARPSHACRDRGSDALTTSHQCAVYEAFMPVLSLDATA
jgi:hypothetical protein